MGRWVSYWLHPAEPAGHTLESLSVSVTPSFSRRPLGEDKVDDFSASVVAGETDWRQTDRQEVVLAGQKSMWYHEFRDR